MTPCRRIPLFSPFKLTLHLFKSWKKGLFLFYHYGIPEAPPPRRRLLRFLQNEFVENELPLNCLLFRETPSGLFLPPPLRCRGIAEVRKAFFASFPPPGGLSLEETSLFLKGMEVAAILSLLKGKRNSLFFFSFPPNLGSSCLKQGRKVPLGTVEQETSTRVLPLFLYSFFLPGRRCKPVFTPLFERFSVSF